MITMVTLGRVCADCGCRICLPQELYEAAQRSPQIHFYCAYGHKLFFAPKKKEQAPAAILTLVKK